MRELRHCTARRSGHRSHRLSINRDFLLEQFMPPASRQSSQTTLQDCQPVCSACDQNLCCCAWQLILEGGSLARIYVSRERLPMMHRAGWQAHDQPDGVRLVRLGSRSQRASDGGSDFGTRRASGSAARNISEEFGGRSVAADCDAGQLTTCLGPDQWPPLPFI